MSEDVQFNFADGGLEFFPASAHRQEQQESCTLQAQVRKKKRRHGAGATATAAASSPAAERLQQQHAKLSAIEKGHKRHLHLLFSHQKKQQQEGDSEEECVLSRAAYLSSCVSARTRELQKQQQLLQRAIIAKAKKKKRKECKEVVFKPEKQLALNSTSDGTTSPQLGTPTAETTQGRERSLPFGACEAPEGIENRRGEELQRQKHSHENRHEADGPEPQNDCEQPRLGSKGRPKQANHENHEERLGEDDEGMWEDERTLGRGWATGTEQRQSKIEIMRGTTKGGRSILIRRVFDVKENLTKKRTKTRSRQKNIRKDKRPETSRPGYLPGSVIGIE